MWLSRIGFPETIADRKLDSVRRIVSTRKLRSIEFARSATRGRNNKSSTEGSCRSNAV